MLNHHFGISLLNLLVFTVFSFAPFAISQLSFSSMNDPESFYSMIELVCTQGYSIQEHTIVTDDGYILTAYRIPNGKKRPRVPKSRNQYQQVHTGYHPDFADCVKESLYENSTGPVAFFVHGLNAASDSWVLQGAEKDLAFLLADKGYDVWFSNSRGNFYSRQHKSLKPTEIPYWDFSFHEIGVYDVTSTIDYILNYTGQEKLVYIGHSMGTTLFFVMASTRPEYNDKVHLFVAMCPVGHIRRKSFSEARLSIIRTVLNLARALQRLGVHEFFPRTTISTFLAKTVCALGSPFQNLCYDFGFFFTGFHSKLFLKKKLSLYLTHSFSGSSIKTFFHFEQLLDAPNFAHYDYGPEKNLEKYSQPNPPFYDLRKVTTPTALYYSKGDYIADVRDVANIKRLLPNVIEDQMFTRFNHVDFIWAYNAKDFIFVKIMRLIEQVLNR